MTANALARTTGSVYLIMIVTASFAYYMWRRLTQGDAAGVLDHIHAAQTLFVASILIGAIGYIAWLILGLLLYRLFETYGQIAAALLLAFVGVGVALSLAGVGRQVDALWLIRGTESLPALSGDQLQTQTMLALHGYDRLFIVSSVFSGLWLIPLGWLVFRCGFVPKALGILLMLGSVSYLMIFPAAIIDPGFDASLASRVIFVMSGIPSLIGEFGTCLWLLIRGARPTEPSQRPR